MTKKTGLNFEIPQIYSSLTFPTTIEENAIIEGKKSIFSIYPFKKGYSVTFGNSLRRALLSSIYGTCVCAIKISGVSHQFSPIKSVKEDVSTIIANLKQLVLSTQTPITTPTSVSFSITKKGIVTSDSIPFPSEIKNLTPKTYLFEVIDSAKFDIEIFISSGFGYEPAEQVKNDFPITTIPIDCYYSPILNVVFSSEEKIVDGSSKNDEKLLLEIETNGSIKPIESLKIACFLLRQYYKFVIDFDENTLIPQREDDIEFNPYLIKTVFELDLTVRAHNCLRSSNITLVGDLVQKTEQELVKTPNFGRKSLTEVQNTLAAIGLHLGMKIDDWDRIKSKHEDNNSKKFLSKPSV
jgi:DNA-directed RNA polymerase subunit alpha